MKDLFGVEVVEPERKKTNGTAVDLHKQLISLHGTTENERCKNCASLITKQFAGRYFKCEESGKTNGNAKTDWRCNWQACGKFKPIQK